MGMQSWSPQAPRTLVKSYVKFLFIKRSYYMHGVTILTDDMFETTSFSNKINTGMNK